MAGLHKRTLTPVAVKVIYMDVRIGADELDQMVFVDLNRKLHSAFSPKYIEHFEDGEYLYAVTNLMNRGDLHSYLQTRYIPYLTEAELRPYFI